MRSPKVLADMVEGLKKWAPARYDVVAIDADEAAWFAAYFKGKRGVGHIGVTLGKPEDLIPTMDRVRGPWPDDTPANPVKVDPKPKATRKPATMGPTEDGY